jgi:hypothetical protein
LRTQACTLLIKSLARELGVEAGKLVDDSNGRAIFIHPRLAIPYAMWFSPEYAASVHHFMLRAETGDLSAAREIGDRNEALTGNVTLLLTASRATITKLKKRNRRLMMKSFIKSAKMKKRCKTAMIACAHEATVRQDAEDDKRIALVERDVERAKVITAREDRDNANQLKAEAEDKLQDTRDQVNIPFTLFVVFRCNSFLLCLFGCVGITISYTLLFLCK